MLDKGIIDLCKKGDRKAQEKVYKHYASKMSAVCLRYCRTSFEAEDVFHDSILKVFKHLHSYKEEYPFDVWVKRITINTAINHYNKNIKFSDHDSINSDANENESGFIDSIDYLSDEELLLIINKLPDGYRLIFNLYGIEGYTHKEIAEMLHISEVTSRTQFFKARKLIKSILINHKKISNEYQQRQ